MLLGMLSLRAAPFIVLTNAADMRLGSLQGRKEREPERVGCGRGSDARRKASLSLYLLLSLQLVWFVEHRESWA